MISIHLIADLGWRFVTPDEKLPGENVTPDPINGVRHIRELYLLADPNYSGRFSVPVLWDKKRKTIVSNESSEIIRMLNTAFNALTNESGDYYPPELRSEIDAVNDLVYPNINNGVYRAGF